MRELLITVCLSLLTMLISNLIFRNNLKYGSVNVFNNCYFSYKHVNYKFFTRCFSTSPLCCGSDEGRLHDDDDDGDSHLLSNFTKRVESSLCNFVYVIQPKIKWGPHKNRNTTPELMLQESVALAETLPNWKVCGTSITNVDFNTTKKKIFGTGLFGKLTNQIKANPRIDSVFINVDMLLPAQHIELYKSWRIPVYDRYHIVLLIFKTYAKSKISKLQISLAELPYARMRLHEMQTGALPDTLDFINTLKVCSTTDRQELKDLITERRVQLEKALEKVRDRRRSLREKVSKEQLPIVAVVGYTNSGKTSLIKCLTGDSKLVPVDRMFATLDVSLHLGILPSSRIKTYFADTVGFVSNIPTTLVASFEATLDDIRCASILIHVRDISHPDSSFQKMDVLKTFEKLALPEKLTKNMIEVCNKVDRVEDMSSLEPLSDNSFYISCANGIGLSELQDQIEKTLKLLEGYITVTLKVPNGGDELRYLEQNAGISKCIPTEDGNHLLVTTTLKEAALKLFMKYYGNLIHRNNF